MGVLVLRSDTFSVRSGGRARPPLVRSGVRQRSWPNTSGSGARPGSPPQTLRTRHVRALAAGTNQPGGNVLDRPGTAAPGLGDKRDTKKKKPPQYRVMLHNDSFNRREYVVQVLMKVVDGYTVDDAVNVMQKAHVDGLACVISCSQEDAETYCEGLRGNGLISSVEPDS